MAEITLIDQPTAAGTAQAAEQRIAGLDGLRALAVLAVVVFHFWPEVLPGGFLGVTLFFSLSGYLLTTRVLRERAQTGTVSIRTFYARRARRLLPASLLTIGLIVVGWYALGWYTPELANSATGALFQVTNWVEIFRSQAYGTTSDTNPFLHFWSLAIEEQFYWVFPVVAAVCVTRARWATAMAVGFLACVLVALTNSGDAPVVYFSTFTRVGEILAGALLAIALHGRGIRVETHARRLATPVGLAGMGVLAVLCVRSSLDTASYYEGALLAVGVLAALTVGAVAHSRLLGRALDNGAMRWIGARSYGVYLFHWPLIVLFRERHVVGAPYWALLSTAVLTTASYRFLETPVRRRTMLRRRPMSVLVPCVAVLTILPQFLPTTPTLVGGIDFADARARAEAALPTLPALTSAAAAAPVTLATAAPSTTQAAPPTTSLTTTAVAPTAAPSPGRTVVTAAPRITDPPTTAAAATTQPAPTSPPPPVRYVVLGDSKALALGLAAGFANGPVLHNLATWGRDGCPLGRGGSVRMSAREGDGRTVSEGCDWASLLPPLLAAAAPLDVALVYSGTWDVAQRKVSALGDDWVEMADPAYRTWLLSELLAFVDLLHDNGVPKVILLTDLPHPAMAHAAEYATMWNSLLLQAAAQRPGGLEVVDLAAWVLTRPEPRDLVKDGTHFTYEPDGGTGMQVMEAFLIDEILRAAGREPASS